MQVALIALSMEHTPFPTAVAMDCVPIHFLHFTNALTRAGLCSAIRLVLTSRVHKARQSKPTALLTGRKEVPIILWPRWTAAMSALWIRSQVSDVLFTRKYTLDSCCHSRRRRSVICTPQQKDTEQCHWSDVRLMNLWYKHFILSEDNTLYILWNFLKF